MDTWKTILKTNIKHIDQAISFFSLEEHVKLIDTSQKFAINIPLRIANKIKKGTLADPILLQYIPLKTTPLPSFSSQPVNDELFAITPKILKKYSSRALILTTSGCAMHCRYCFRQNYPYENSQKSFDNEMDAIAKDPNIQEVILSGGDPLLLDDKYLSLIYWRILKIPHIKVIRFHSKFIMGIPERITDRFIDILKSSPIQTIFILHVNHPNEFDEDIFASIRKLQKAQIPVLTQSVLLKDINDNVSTLRSLFLKLIQNGIIPYYLHELDKVNNAENFFVPREKAMKLMNELKNSLPGYAVPRYVVEEPGKKSKTILF